MPILFSMRRILTVVVLLDQEHREAAGVGGAFLAAGQHDRDVGQAVGDEALDAVEMPLAGGLVEGRPCCTAPRSEPASASVRTMAPETSPRAKRGRTRAFVSGSPYSSIIEAISCRPKTVIRPLSARATISTIIW